MVKSCGYILIALLGALSLRIDAIDYLEQKQPVKVFSNACSSSYSYTDYGLLAGAAYLMYLSSYFLVRDAAIAVHFGYLDPYDIDRFKRFLGYIPEHLLKLFVIGGLAYKVATAHQPIVKANAQE